MVAGRLAGPLATLGFAAFLLLGCVYWAFSLPVVSWLGSTDPAVSPFYFYVAWIVPVVVWGAVWLATAFAAVRDPRRRPWLPVVALALYGPQIAGYLYGLHWLANYD